MSELARRVLFAVIAVPITLWIVFAGGAALAALLAVASALAAWEFFRLASGDRLRPLEQIGVALAGLVPLGVHARYLGLWMPSWGVVAIVLIGLLSVALLTRPPAEHPLGGVAATALGVVYTGGLLSFAYAIRYHEYTIGNVGYRWGPVNLHLATGGLLLVLPLLATWATDIGAYALGRAFGRRKLMPSVSPGKTVVGAVGGIVVTVLVVWVYVRWVLHPAAQLDFRRGGLVAFSVLLSVAAQLGDLVESLFKREAGVKDSSHLIPGHGGVLDRLDSLIFVLPVAFVLFGALLVWAP